MANEKLDVLVKALLEGVGGRGNIRKLEHCMTRVRLEVVDEKQLDIATLKQLRGLKGYWRQGDQHQFIVGPGAAAKITHAMQQLLVAQDKPHGAEFEQSPKEVNKATAHVSAKCVTPMSGVLRQLANIFIPLIPAFIASGLIMGLVNLLSRPDITGQWAGQYPNILALLTILGGAVFAIMNILVGINAARVWGGSPAMGGVMAAILSSPALGNVTLFSEQLQPGRGGVIAVLLVVACMCWLERRLRHWLPESLDLILNPLLTTLLTAGVALMVLQPLGGMISDAIAHGVEQALDKGGLLLGALLAGAFLPLVLSGLHQGLVPIHVELIQVYGANPLLPILAMAGLGQVGAALAVLQKTHNPRLKTLIKNSLFVGVLGIGEPLIFGVTLPLGRPFVAACLAGAVGGAMVCYWKVASVITFGISGLPLALTILSGQVLAYLLCAVITIFCGWLFTLLIGFHDPQA